MSLEAIRQKIIRDAEAEAARVLSEARHEKKTAVEEARARLATRAEKDRAKLIESLRDRKTRMREHALREEERNLLNTRRTLIDRAVDSAVDKLLESDDYPVLIAALLSRCAFSGDVEVVVAARDADLVTQAFLDRHSSTGVRFRLAAGQHNSRGGVILRSGRVSQNATIEMVASLVHEEIVMELSRKLPVEKLEAM